MKWNYTYYIFFLCTKYLYTRWMTTTRWNSTCNDSSSSQRARLWLWSGKIKREREIKKKARYKNNTQHNGRGSKQHPKHHPTKGFNKKRREKHKKMIFMSLLLYFAFRLLTSFFFYILEILFFLFTRFFFTISSAPPWCVSECHARAAAAYMNVSCCCILDDSICDWSCLARLSVCCERAAAALKHDTHGMVRQQKKKPELKLTISFSLQRLGSTLCAAAAEVETCLC